MIYKIYNKENNHVLCITWNEKSCNDVYDILTALHGYNFIKVVYD